MSAITLVTQSFEGHPIPFQSGDAFVNATEMCKAFGREPFAFLRLSTTNAFQEALANDLGALPSALVVTKRGGNQIANRESNGLLSGTWLHPDLGVECARWLSPKFAIWCNRVIRGILAGGLAVVSRRVKIEGEKRVETLLELMAPLMAKGMSADAAGYIAADMVKQEAIDKRHAERQANPFRPWPKKSTLPARPKGRPPVEFDEFQVAKLCTRPMKKWELRDAIKQATGCGDTKAYEFITAAEASFTVKAESVGDSPLIYTRAK